MVVLIATCLQRVLCALLVAIVVSSCTGRRGSGGDDDDDGSWYADGDADGDAETCGDGECAPGETALGCPADCCDNGGYACRLVGPSCGCDAGSQCRVDRSGAEGRVCLPEGNLGAFEDCSQRPDDCGPGLECSPLDLDQPGSSALSVCRPYCDDDDDCFGAGSRCGYTFLDELEDPIPDALSCSMSCDPMTGAGCPGDARCDVLNGTDPLFDGDYTECFPSGNGVARDPCDSQLDCASGFLCTGSILNPDERTCQERCIMDADDCPNFQYCVSLGGGGHWIDGVEYGICE